MDFIFLQVIKSTHSLLRESYYKVLSKYNFKDYGFRLAQRY